MANETAKIDDNYQKSLTGVSDITGEIRKLKADDTTGALKVVGTLTVDNLDEIGDVNVGSPSAGDDGKALVWDNATGTFILGTSGSGDVVGPVSSTDNAIARFDLTTGKLLQNSGVTIDDSNNIAGANSIAVGNTGLTVGSSVPFSDTAGTLTLQNIDAIDATTETTLESAIDSLANLTTVGTLTSGNADQIVTDAQADGTTKGKAAFNANDFNDAAGVISLDYTNGQKATTSQAGYVSELATSAETTTGTDTSRVITPDGLAGSDYGKRVVTLLIAGAGSSLSVGDGASGLFYRIPSIMNGYNLVDVAAHVQTAGTTGTLDIQIHNVTDAVDMLSTKLTIDSGEKDSLTAATPAVINTANDDVSTGDELRVDIDAVHTTPATGLVVELTFQLP